jgi:hypothetical protein
MYPHQKEAIVDLAEGMTENAAPDPASRWLLGVALAAGLATYGAWCAIAQTAYVPRTQPLGIHQWHGEIAVAIGCLLLSLAAVGHAHWFWSCHPRWHGLGQLGKLSGMFAVLASLAWLLYEFFFANF